MSLSKLPRLSSVRRSRSQKLLLARYHRTTRFGRLLSGTGLLPRNDPGARSFSLRDTTKALLPCDCVLPLPHNNHHVPSDDSRKAQTPPSQPTPSPCRLETRDSLGLHRQWPDSGSLPPKRRFPTDRGQPYGMRGRDGSFGWRKVCQRYGCALRWGRLASPVSDVLWAGASPPPALFPKT